AVRLLVAEVVAAEEHVRRVPLGREPFVEYVVAEINEAAGLGVDFDLPSERHQRVAPLPAVPFGGRGRDRVADHQQLVAGDQRAGRRGGGGRGGGGRRGLRDGGRVGVAHL